MRPNLNFSGHASDVLAHYQAALGGELEIMRFAGSPAAEFMAAAPMLSSRHLTRNLRGGLRSSRLRPVRLSGCGNRVIVRARSASTSPALGQ